MAKKERKPYHPPTIRSERVYERRSLACGKTAPPKNNKACIRNFKLS
jgi:hypothetical protein